MCGETLSDEVTSENATVFADYAHNDNLNEKTKFASFGKRGSTLLEDTAKNT